MSAIALCNCIGVKLLQKKMSAIALCNCIGVKLLQKMSAIALCNCIGVKLLQKKNECNCTLQLYWCKTSAKNRITE